MNPNVDLGIYDQPENRPDRFTLKHRTAELDDNHRSNLMIPDGEWGQWLNGGRWLNVGEYTGVGINESMMVC
ncbi:MAG: hypothetical protein ACAF41_01890 [Leptolyngbya sp. BL-A-14]